MLLLSVLIAAARPLCAEGDPPGGTTRNFVFVITGKVIFSFLFLIHVQVEQNQG